MSHLNFKSYDGFGMMTRAQLNYSQSVRVPASGDLVYISGQGGFDPTSDDITKLQLHPGPDAERAQIEQAWKNVEIALKNAGAEMKHVFKYTSYHNPLSDKTTELMVAATRRVFPDHQPTWTEIGVAQLGAPGMLVEIEVVAHVPRA